MTPVVICPVPGCERTIKSQHALGPHLASHRRKGDAGVPPPKHPPKKHQRVMAPAKVKQPKPKPVIQPNEIADGVLSLLYPVAVPTERVREIARWMLDTDRLSHQALADQQEHSHES